MEAFLRDLRYGLQALAQKPGFTAAALLALALGIGANSAIFSVVNAALIRPLPYRNPERLAMVLEASGGLEVPAAPANFVDWKEQNQVFAEMAAFARSNLNLTGMDEPLLVHAATVTPNLFHLLGVEARIGRMFSGQDLEVVLSHAFWQSRFGSDPKVLGKTLQLNDRLYTVVGVAAPDLQFFRDPEMYVVGRQGLPMPGFAFSDDLRTLREVQYVSVLGRLKPGIGLARAQAGMDTVARRLQKQYPVTNASWGVKVVPIKERLVGKIRPALLILSAAVGLVLLIACTNVANLLLARMKVREREMALRVALGASRNRLVRQLLTESLLLSFLGTVLGLLLAAWTTRLLSGLSLKDLPRMDQVRIDGPVLGFTMLVAGLTALLIGFVPALRASRYELQGSLQEGGSKSTAGPRLASVLSLFVVCEIAVALVLLVGAGLLIKSFVRLQTVDPGFDPKNTLTLRLSLPESRYAEEAKVGAFFHQIVDRVGKLAGVEAVGATAHLPVSGANSSVPFEVEGVPPPQEKLVLDFHSVTPGYLHAMRIPLLEGRDVAERDRQDQPQVAIVNEVLAKRFWPHGGAVGHRLRLGQNAGGKSDWFAIIGVVGDVRHRALSTAPMPDILLSYLQAPEISMWLVVRTSQDPLTLVPQVRKEVLAVDKDLPLQDVATFAQLLAKSTAEQRFASSLLGVLAALAVVLALLGVYSVMSFSVSRRTSEMGLRMALGAQKLDVLRLVTGHGAFLALVGVGLGLVASSALTRLLRSLLFEVSTTDPWIFATFALTLILAALAASYIPARRAMRADPLSALKLEWT